MIDNSSRGASKKKLKVFSSLKDVLEALGQGRSLAEEMAADGSHTLSADVMQALWALFFGKASMAGDGTARSLLVLGALKERPFFGWHFKDEDLTIVLTLLGTVIHQLSVSTKTDLMTPFGKMLMERGAEFDPDADFLAPEDDSEQS
jgi:hypothetical protein